MRSKLQNEIFHGALIGIGLDAMKSMALSSYRS